MRLELRRSSLVLPKRDLKNTEEMQFLQWRRELQNAALLKLRCSSTALPIRDFWRGDAVLTLLKWHKLQNGDTDFSLLKRRGYELYRRNSGSTELLIRRGLEFEGETRLWVVERRVSESFGRRDSELLRDATLIHLEGAALNCLEDSALECWETWLWFT